jgi:hypothetical protein
MSRHCRANSYHSEKNKANASSYAQNARVYWCCNQIVALPFFLFYVYIYIYFYFITIVVSKSNKRVLPYVACTRPKSFGIIKYEQIRSACRYMCTFEL